MIMKNVKYLSRSLSLFFRINAKFKLSRLSVSLWENRLSWGSFHFVTFISGSAQLTKC